MSNNNKIMKQEDKDLLLIDLSARIPYKVKCEVYNRVGTLIEVNAYGFTVTYHGGLEDMTCQINNIKPYLFPLTEEILDKATEESNNLYKELICSDSDLYIENNKSNILLLQAKIRSSVIKYFHIHHIDYNGLIEKGLANDATNLNIY